MYLEEEWKYFKMKHRYVVHICEYWFQVFLICLCTEKLNKTEMCITNSNKLYSKFLYTLCVEELCVLFISLSRKFMQSEISRM